ncbi:unnamed protein product [Lymnaea stagnalis]|uniref:Uncharacterized protein n=1 Tax=Lymnaea stagnalis TaxID=6523 RepID=A0AAV2HZY3_LYMST
MDIGPYRKLEDGDDVDVTCSVDDVSHSLTEEPEAGLENGTDDVTEMEDLLDGKADTDQSDYEKLRTYYEAFVFILRKAESDFKQADDFCCMRQFRALQRIAGSQIPYLTLFQTWATGTTHFRSDVTLENGVTGLLHKSKIIKEWNQMKEERDSFRDRFQRDNYGVKETGIWKQGREHEGLTSGDNMRRYGGTAWCPNATNEDFKEKLAGMSLDFEDAAKALHELNSAYENVNSTCCIVGYFQLKWGLASYMSVVQKIMNHNSCYL